MSVTTSNQIEEASKKAIESLYGSDIQDFKVRVYFPYTTDPILDRSNSSDSRIDSWDVQVTFLLSENQYTVDLIILKKNGQVIYSRLIDTMIPL
jgi:hypothetical protein